MSPNEKCVALAITKGETPDRGQVEPYGWTFAVIKRVEETTNKKGRQGRKTKMEEKDELIATTKTAVLEKYAKKATGKKAGGTTQMTGSGQNFQDKGNFQLEEKVTPRNVGEKLLAEGYMQAYIDFFYITNETTPSYIQPSPQLMKEYRLNKRVKQKYDCV